MVYTVLSTAAFCLWDIEAKEKLAHCENLGFEHIQIALSGVKMVYALQAFLKANQTTLNFKTITCHAPWCGIKYGHNEKCRRVLEALREIHEICHFESVIVRVDCIADMEVLLASKLPISIENSNHKGSWPLFKRIIHETDLPISLNLNRAVRDNDYLDELLALYSSQIARVMLSGYTAEMGRTPLLDSGQITLLERIQALEVPLILEGLFEPNNLQAIRLERQAILSYHAGFKSGVMHFESLSQAHYNRLSGQAVSA